MGIIDSGKQPREVERQAELLAQAIDMAESLFSRCDPERAVFALTHDQIAMVHHALANLGNTDPLKAEAFRELFDMFNSRVQPSRP